MQNEQEFYRCLVSDTAGRILWKIRDILDSRVSEKCSAGRAASPPRCFSAVCRRYFSSFLRYWPV